MINISEFIKSFSEFIKSSLSNPFFSIASFFLAVVGIIIAIIFYLKSKRIKKAVFSVRSVNLIKDFSKKLVNLEVLYSGSKVENLTVSKVALWNDGNETIRQEDIALSDPLEKIGACP